MVLITAPVQMKFKSIQILSVHKVDIYSESK